MFITILQTQLINSFSEIIDMIVVCRSNKRIHQSLSALLS